MPALSPDQRARLDEDFEQFTVISKMTGKFSYEDRKKCAFCDKDIYKQARYQRQEVTLDGNGGPIFGKVAYFCSDHCLHGYYYQDRDIAEVPA